MRAASRAALAVGLTGAAVGCLLAFGPRGGDRGSGPGSRPPRVRGTRPGRRPSPGLSRRDQAARLATQIEALRPLATDLAPPGPRDWLKSHDEPGQSFREYLASDPVTPGGGRDVLYVMTLGDLTPSQERVVKLTAEFLGIYFGLPVRSMDPVPLSSVPARSRRVHPTWGDRQILTGYVLREVLLPRLPEDAAAALALTATDLWPGRGWNFVFGQASLRERVGVWSIHRNGDPGAGAAEFRLCLLRTIKTASHETGHMFSMLHCTRHECNMCGSNHREESDRRPLALCPECVAKVAWATGCELLPRYRKLEAFARREGLAGEAEFYAECARALSE